MKLDRAIKNFTEKYDKTAMKYIDDISSDFGLIYHKQSIPAFNMSTAIDKFAEYVEGYADYKIRAYNENKDEKQLTQEEIDNTTKKWCENIFSSKEITENSQLYYDKIPAFIESYTSGVDKLITCVESNKERMLSEGVDVSDIGAVNDYADMFIDNLHKHFDVVMEKVLMASGYTTDQRLSGKVKPVKEESNYFM